MRTVCKNSLMKSMSKTANYRSLEKKVQELLEKDGWIVERARYNSAIRNGKWTQKKLDFFHVFDLIALHSNPAYPVRFIQICVSGQVNAHKRKIDELFHIYPEMGNSFSVEIIVPEKRTALPQKVKRWKIVQIHRRIGHDWYRQDNLV